MKKIIILLSFFLCLGSVNAFDLKSKNAILYNLDNNTVLYELQPDQEIYIASLTKIMTSIVAIEQINDLNNKIVIKDVMLDGLIEQDASMAGFEVGDVVSYKDLLYALLLPSGADAAYSLAYSLVGSEKEFVKLMNDKAQQLGLKNTHYVNITGLDIDNHYSTVRDISILLKYALTNETFKKIYTTTYYTTSNGLNLKSSLQYYFDKFDIEADYIIGSKTGSTDEAGYCLSSIANYNNINYLLITAGADYEEKLPNHIIDSKQIYEYYFGDYDNINIVNNKQIITTIKTKNSKEKEYNIIAPKTITYYLNKDTSVNDFVYNYVGKNKVSSLMKKGEKIGYFTISYKNKILQTVDVFYDQKLSFSLLNFIKDNFIIIIIGLFIIYNLLKKPFKKYLK